MTARTSWLLKRLNMKQYKLSFYVPIDHAEKVKEAIFLAGAGRQGEYDQCCFETKGVGQFRPLKNAKPFVGEVSTLEKVEELKVEVLVNKSELKGVIKNLLTAHPYEEPAFDIIELKSFRFVDKFKKLRSTRAK
jgi:hypothetical protein